MRFFASKVVASTPRSLKARPDETIGEQAGKSFVRTAAQRKVSMSEDACRVWRMPFDERMAMLLCSVIQHDSEAMAAVHGMIAMIERMTVYYTSRQRIELAERMRDAADRIERR